NHATARLQPHDETRRRALLPFRVRRIEQRGGDDGDEEANHSQNSILLILIVDSGISFVSFVSRIFPRDLAKKSLGDPKAPEKPADRPGRLTPSAERRWGRMSAAQMVAHLVDSMRMATGEISVPSKNLPLPFTAMH